MLFDTIVGVSTKLGESAISVVRVSGEDALQISSKILRGMDLSSVPSHTAHYGFVYDEEQMIDEIVATVFLRPRSFTTEDTVEISCHGGFLIANEIVRLLLRNGARLAEKGEFTKRAFLNGRVDLAKAESIMDVISAKTRTQLQIATQQLRGDVSELVHNLQDELLDIIGQIEVNIDYPEYDEVSEMTRNLVEPKLVSLIEKIELTLQKANTGKIIREGVKTVIVGKPNVGKSSLLNSLVKEEKAIVTDVSGTTRDLIEAELNLHGILLRLIDTAGIRDTDDLVEKIGIDRTKKAIEQADLVLLVLDQSESLSEHDRTLLEMTKDKVRILVGNKMDLGHKIDIDNETIISVSAKNKSGLSELESEVRNRFIDHTLIENQETILSNARHIALLETAKQSLLDAWNSSKEGLPVDMVEIDLRNAWHSLGEITGDINDDTLINSLFSRFCLGK